MSNDKEQENPIKRVFVTNFAQPESKPNNGFTMDKPNTYNYFSLCRCEQIANPILPAAPVDTPFFTYVDPFRDIYIDEFWIRVTGIWAAPAAVVYPAHVDDIGYRILLNGIIVIPDIRTPPFPINAATDVNNAWIHPTEEWIQALHPQSPIKISNGDEVVIQWFNNQAHGAVILNTMFKGHSEPVKRQ